MNLYLDNVDSIYFDKSRNYFREVINSYENGNYRSAIVMLYSLVVCDLLLKLNELDDIYNERTAAAILDSVKKNQKQTNSSEWENQLIKDIHDKTHLISDFTFTELRHLHDYRNYSAHPAYNDDFELISPSAQTTIALMNTVLDNILIKPPVFVKNAVDMMTEELSEKREIYIDDIGKLKRFVDTKYLDRMTDSMRISTFRAFWKFVFQLVDDQKCKDNRKINNMILCIICQENSNIIIDDLGRDNTRYTVANNDECLWSLNVLLSHCTELYSVLCQETKDIIDLYLENKTWAKTISWYKCKGLKQHLTIMEQLDLKEDGFYKGIVAYINEKYEHSGFTDALYDIWIEQFGNSVSFDDADFKYYTFIKPILKELTLKQLTELMGAIDSNDQIHNRMRHVSSCCEIYNRIVEIDNDFDFSQYKYFVIPNEQNDDELLENCPF